MKPREDGKTGQVSKDSIVFKLDAANVAMWDYAVYQPTINLWINANHAVDRAGKDQQKFFVKDKVEPFKDLAGVEHTAILYYAYIARGK